MLIVDTVVYAILAWYATNVRSKDDLVCLSLLLSHNLFFSLMGLEPTGDRMTPHGLRMRSLGSATAVPHAPLLHERITSSLLFLGCVFRDISLFTCLDRTGHMISMRRRISGIIEMTRPIYRISRPMLSMG